MSAATTHNERSPASLLRAVRDFPGRLTAPGKPRTAVMVRSGLAAIIVLRLVFRDWWLLSTTPDPLFDKVFAVSWMHGSPSNMLVTGLWGCGLGAALLCVFRIRAHATFVIAWVCFMELCAMWSSSGKVMHNDILLVWAGIPFLFATAPRRGDYAEDERWGWAPRASMTTVAAIYCAAGVQKFRHSGLSWIFSDNLSWVIRQGHTLVGSTVSDHIASLTVVTTTAAAVTVIFEFGAPLLIALRPTRAIFAIVVIGFHLANFLLLGLDYYAWVLTVGVVVLLQAPVPRWVSAPAGRLIGNRRLPEAWSTGQRRGVPSNGSDDLTGTVPA